MAEKTTSVKSTETKSVTTTAIPKKVSSRRVLLAILLFLLGFLLGVMFYVFASGHYGNGRFFLQYPKKAATADKAKPGAEEDPEIGEDTDAEEGEDLPLECPDTEEKECKTYNLPVVVFEAEGLFNNTEKTNLKERVVNPMTAYTLETEERQMVSIAFEKYNGDGDYDYKVLAIFEDGVNTGFLHGDGDAEVEWWTPTCLDTCEFSDAFEAKFPEVVEAYTE